MLTKQIGFKLHGKKRDQFRFVAAALFFLSILLCILLFILQVQAPADDTFRNGLGKLSADYELAYKPNSLYDQPKPGDKEARLLAFVDHIKFKLMYDLKGFEGLPADYEYSVDAKLIARSSESSKYIDSDFIVWQKNYTLIPSTKVSSDGTMNSLEKQADVNLTEYADFIKSTYEQTQFHTINELKLFFHVKAVVHGPIEDAVDNSTVELSVPMIDNLLVIIGTPAAENKLKMMTTAPKPVMNYMPWLLICGVMALLMLAMSIVLAQGNHQPDIEKRFAKTTAKIFKQYGERLVCLENPLPYQQLATISIDGIGEIIKIADEINQPVFYYKADSDEEKKIEFYVFDSGRIYYMVIFGNMGKPSEN